MTLTEFLLARIAEDERAAADWWPVTGVDFFVDTDRWRAECEAKRAIIEMHRPPGLVLRHLALPYADHPDYDPAWRL